MIIIFQIASNVSLTQMLYIQILEHNTVIILCLLLQIVRGTSLALTFHPETLFKPFVLVLLYILGK